MCISPIRIRHPTKKCFIDVPCGRCLECAQKKINDWSFRMLSEMRDKNAYFFTLTYNDDSLPYKLVSDGSKIPCFRKSDVQSMIHAMRDHLRRAGFKIRLKYFISSEYGDNTLRPHYHGIIFGFPFDLKKFNDLLQKYWYYGFVSSSICNQTRIYYALKYTYKNAVIKPIGLHSEADRCFIMCSKNLGSNFLTPEMRNLMEEQLKVHVHMNGFLRTIPKYYRDKVFSEFDKEQIKMRVWEKFDPFARCPDSELDPQLWRLNNYNNKIRKIRNKLNKEKM